MRVRIPFRKLSLLYTFYYSRVPHLATVVVKQFSCFRQVVECLVIKHLRDTHAGSPLLIWSPGISSASFTAFDRGAGFLHHRHRVTGAFPPLSLRESRSESAFCLLTVTQRNPPSRVDDHSTSILSTPESRVDTPAFCISEGMERRRKRTPETSTESFEPSYRNIKLVAGVQDNMKNVQSTCN